MGYYTYYQLSVQPYHRPSLTDYESEALEKEIDLMDVFESGCIDDDFYSDSIKWYDHDEDMLLLSRRFPNILFTLHGDGENQEDMWNAYYANGKMQYCPAEITYPDFNEEWMDSADPVKHDGNDDEKSYSYQTKPNPPRQSAVPKDVDTSLLL